MRNGHGRGQRGESAPQGFSQTRACGGGSVARPVLVKCYAHRGHRFLTSAGPVLTGEAKAPVAHRWGLAFSLTQQAST